MQTSTITVQVFTGCDANNSPTYSTRTVSVIQGTEEAERLKFEQAAIADGATCKTGYGNGFANLLNEIREMSAILIHGTEQTLNVVGKGFNALQDDGILSEGNWQYLPAKISLKSGLLAQLATGSAPDASITMATEKPQTGAALSEQINTEITNLDTTIKTAITEATTQRTQEISQLTTPVFSWDALL